MNDQPVFNPAAVLAWLAACMGVTLLLGGERGARAVIVSALLIAAIEFSASYKKRKR